MPPGWSPMIVGAPRLKRYQAFGNLFAAVGDGEGYRLDRHPTMSRHPVTPMNEADIAIHLARQAKLVISKFTLADLDQPRESIDATMAARLLEPVDAILFDASAPGHLTEIGRLLDAEAHRRTRQDPLFVVGSSGLQYAMTQWWSESGLPSQDTSRFDSFAAVDRALVVSGSASKLTAMQIDAAVAEGFADLPLDARRMVDDATWPAARDEIVAGAARHLDGCSRRCTRRGARTTRGSPG